jgi:hypothetical protein
MILDEEIIELSGTFEQVFHWDTCLFTQISNSLWLRWLVISKRVSASLFLSCREWLTIILRLHPTSVF